MNQNNQKPRGLGPREISAAFGFLIGGASVFFTAAPFALVAGIAGMMIGGSLPTARTWWTGGAGMVGGALVVGIAALLIFPKNIDNEVSKDAAAATNGPDLTSNPTGYIDACVARKDQACARKALDSLPPPARAAQEARIGPAWAAVIEQEMQAESAPEWRLKVAEERAALLPGDTTIRRLLADARAARIAQIKDLLPMTDETMPTTRLGLLQAWANAAPDDPKAQHAYVRERDAMATKIRRSLAQARADDYIARESLYRRLAEIGVQTDAEKAEHAFVIDAANNQRESEQRQRAAPAGYLTLKTSWDNSYGVMTADFRVSSVLPFAVRDPKVECILYGASGSPIDRVTETLFIRIDARKSARATDVNLGFVNGQAERASCRITDVTVE